VLIYFGAERLSFFSKIVPLSATIFLFLKEKQKGFLLLSGLKGEISLFTIIHKRKNNNNLIPVYWDFQKLRTSHFKPETKVYLCKILGSIKA
jgi:hypothetical protein